jgi:hypothetical protein
LSSVGETRAEGQVITATDIATILHGGTGYDYTVVDDPRYIPDPRYTTVRFEITNDNKLQIVRGAVFDHETDGDEVVVTVTASNDPDTTTDDLTATFTLTLTDINDAPPEITSAASESVNENVQIAYEAKGTADVAGEAIEWSLEASTADGFTNDFQAFNINSETGEVTFKTLPDYEATPTKLSYKFNIKATVTSDTNPNNPQFKTQEVTINIANVVEPPRITSPDSVRVNENIGTDVVVYPAAGAVVDGTGSIVWSIEGGDSALFEIDGNDGEVRFRSSPDFENSAGKTSYTFTLKATTVVDDDSVFSTKQVKVELNNLVESSAFTLAYTGQQAVVDEDIDGTTTPQHIGTAALSSAVDVFYSVMARQGDSPVDGFVIDADGRVTYIGDGLPPGGVMLTVFATDADGTTASSDTATLMVTDLARPAVLVATPDLRIGKASTDDSQRSITTLRANDPDGDHVTYAITEVRAFYNDGDHDITNDNNFSIDQNTGEITFTGSALVGVNAPEYFTVHVKANSVDTTSSELHVAGSSDDFRVEFVDPIEVLDIEVARLDDPNREGVDETVTSRVLHENIIPDPDHIVLQARVKPNGVDKDRTDITWSLDILDDNDNAYNGNAYFNIDSSTGEMWLIQSPDFETQPVLTLRVRGVAADGETVGTVSFSVDVEDIETEGPPSITSMSTAMVNENIAFNSVVYEARGTSELDSDDGSEIIWSLEAATEVVAGMERTIDDYKGFTIDADTGDVHIINSPDFETKNTYKFNVKATTGPNTVGQSSATKQVTLTINNVPEGSLRFNTAPPENLEFIFSSTPVPQDDIFTFHATSRPVSGLDPATGQPYRVQYELQSLPNELTAFTLGQTTGVFSYSPTQSRVDNTYSDDSIAAGTYEIAVDAYIGSTTVTQTFSLTVRVKSTTTTEPSTTEPSTTGVVIVNHPEDRIQIVEGALAGPGTIPVYDFNANIENVRWTYTVVSTNGPINPFFINEETGELRLRNAPDRRVSDEYTIRVTATDVSDSDVNNHPSVSEDITITISPRKYVGDADNFDDPYYTSNPEMFTLTELADGRPRGGADMVIIPTPVHLFQIRADSLPNGASPFFSIESAFLTRDEVPLTRDGVQRDLKSSFRIAQGESGLPDGVVLYTGDPIDLNAGDTVTLVFSLKASNADGDEILPESRYTATATIVHDVALNPVITSPTKVSVAENVLSGRGGEAFYTAEGRPGKLKLEKDDTQGEYVDAPPIIWGIGGTDANRFIIDADTGKVYFASSPNHEGQSSYNFNLLAYTGNHVGGQQTVKQDVTVTITNMFEDDEPYTSIPDGIILTEGMDGTVTPIRLLQLRSDLPTKHSFGIIQQDIRKVGQATVEPTSDFDIIRDPGQLGAILVYRGKGFGAGDTVNLGFRIIGPNGNKIDGSDYIVPITVAKSVTGAPVITSQTTVSVDENVASGRYGEVIYTAQGTAGQVVLANNSEEDAEIIWSVEGPDANAFIFNPETGEVYFAESPDYELFGENEPKTYTFILKAYTGRHSTAQEVTVTINDLGEPIHLHGTRVVGTGTSNVVVGHSDSRDQVIIGQKGRHHENIISGDGAGDKLIIGGLGDDNIYLNSNAEEIILYRFESTVANTKKTDGGDTVNDFTFRQDVLMLADTDGSDNSNRNGVNLDSDFLAKNGLNREGFLVLTADNERAIAGDDAPDIRVKVDDSVVVQIKLLFGTATDATRTLTINFDDHVEDARRFDLDDEFTAVDGEENLYQLNSDAYHLVPHLFGGADYLHVIDASDLPTALTGTDGLL